MLPLPVIQNVDPTEGRSQVVEVSFKGNRTAYYATDDDTLRVGEYVLVQAGSAKRGQPGALVALRLPD